MHINLQNACPNLASIERASDISPYKERHKFEHEHCFAAFSFAGHKARSYLLLLIKMNRVVVETAGGLISYRIL